MDSDSDFEDEIIAHLAAEIERERVEAEAAQVIRRRNRVNRDRAQAEAGLRRDYFNPDQVYDQRHFEERFRMSRPLFLRIVGDLEQNFEYFQQKPDCRGYMGFSSLLKCTSAIRHLGYGSGNDCWDEYLKIAETTARDTLYHFCNGNFIIIIVILFFM